LIGWAEDCFAAAKQTTPADRGISTGEADFSGGWHPYLQASPMARKTYYEKLKDPRWQKKRLEVMKAASFKCQVCGAEDKTLNVHHGYYSRSLEPWEYPDNTLWCLCEECHKETQDCLEFIQRRIGAIHPQLLQQFIESRSLGVIRGFNDFLFAWECDTLCVMDPDCYEQQESK